MQQTEFVAIGNTSYWLEFYTSVDGTQRLSMTEACRNHEHDDDCQLKTFDFVEMAI